MVKELGENPLFTLKHPKKEKGISQKGTSPKIDMPPDTILDVSKETSADKLPDTLPEESYNMQPLPQPDTGKGTLQSTNTNTDTHTGTDTDTYSLLNELVTPEETMVRHVCYLNQEQSNFVKDMARQLTKRNKGKKVTESEIFRTAIDYLMKSINKK